MRVREESIVRVRKREKLEVSIEFDFQVWHYCLLVDNLCVDISFCRRSSRRHLACRHLAVDIFTVDVFIVDIFLSTFWHLTDFRANKFFKWTKLMFWVHFRIRVLFLVPEIFRGLKAFIALMQYIWL
jgi:hypothetical protein